MVVRRIIIAKAVLSIIGPDIQRAASTLQFCAGQSSGVEAAIHCMKSVFSDDNLKVFYLLMPAMHSTHFNRAVSLHNIQCTCPAFSTILISISISCTGEEGLKAC